MGAFLFDDAVDAYGSLRLELGVRPVPRPHAQRRAYDGREEKVRNRKDEWNVGRQVRLSKMNSYMLQGGDETWEKRRGRRGGGSRSRGGVGKAEGQ